MGSIQKSIKYKKGTKSNLKDSNEEKNSAWSIFEEKWYLLMNWKRKIFNSSHDWSGKASDERVWAVYTLHNDCFCLKSSKKATFFLRTIPDPSVCQKWFRTSLIFWEQKNLFEHGSKSKIACHFLNHSKNLKFSQNHFGPTETIHERLA